MTLERVFHDKFKTKEDLDRAHESSSNRTKMSASNVITHESITQVEQLIDKIQESTNSIQDSQKHELAACFTYIESLATFEEEYAFWQLVQVVVVFFVVIWQIVTLRNYFRAKKLV